MTFIDKVKLQVWRIIYKFFPSFQKFFLKCGLIWHEKGRQRYHVGWLAPGRTLEELKNHLNSKWSFGNHFIAWEDSDQVLSWRKLVNFRTQYHLRVFSDGEIRGHFELTPEAHPIKHFKEVGESERKEDFLKFLGDFVTEKEYISRLSMDPNAYDPDSEIMLDFGNYFGRKSLNKSM